MTVTDYAHAKREINDTKSIVKSQQKDKTLTIDITSDTDNERDDSDHVAQRKGTDD
jgi:hypothetical protein